MHAIIGLTTSVRKSGDGGPAMIAALKRAGDAYVKVGVVKDAGTYKGGQTIEEVAACNEFGTKTAPERSFLRRTIYEQLPIINRARREQLMAMVEERRSPTRALATLGTMISAMIVRTILSNVPPPLKPKYVAWKRRQGLKLGTLRATELLRRSIGYKVVTGGGGH